MLVLRQGGQFTDQQIDFHLTKTFRYFILTAFVLVISGYLRQLLVGLFGLVLLIISAKQSLRYWARWRLGKQGESAVVAALTVLPNDYLLLNDLVLPEGKGNVDHLLIGPTGLFVIETKNYKTRVKCVGDQWFVNGFRVKSLSRQVKRNAVMVRDNIQQVCRDHGARTPFVNPLLVFVRPNSRLMLETPTVPVLTAGQLAGYIQNYQPPDRNQAVRQPNALPHEVIHAIVHRFHYLQSPAADSRTPHATTARAHS